MLEYAERALRVEITLKSNALREMGLHIAANWTPETAKMLLLNSLKGLEMSNNFSLSNDVLATLPPRVRLAYAA
ncbi:hypothetical protein R0J89_22085, partial [Psychrobacter sp. SIMBA_152]